ncbi:MAG: RNA polymerase sigma-70 factor [Saprospiraceae bacterium]
MRKEENFKSLFQQYYTPLCNYANSFVKNWDSSKDIVQSTFLKVWKNWSSFEGALSQKNYLFRAVKNTLIDYVKKEKRMDVLKNGNKSLFISTEKELDSFIIMSEIMISLDKLKPKNRQIFILHKLEGLTYPEIAKFLGVSERTVEDNMARAIKALRKDLVKNEKVFL